MTIELSNEQAANELKAMQEHIEPYMSVVGLTAYNMAIKALEKQQNTKGNWIHWTDDYKDYVTCSCCEYGEEGEVLLSDKTPFCPICGADMREGAE